MSDFDTTMVRDLALADEKRNTRVQKYCSFCGQGFLGEQDDSETRGKDCKEA